MSIFKIVVQLTLLDMHEFSVFFEPTDVAVAENLRHIYICGFVMQGCDLVDTLDRSKWITRSELVNCHILNLRRNVTCKGSITHTHYHMYPGGLGGAVVNSVGTVIPRSWFRSPTLPTDTLDCASLHPGVRWVPGLGIGSFLPYVWLHLW